MPEVSSKTQIVRPKDFRRFPFGSLEYVYLHGRSRISRGKNPSMPLLPFQGMTKAILRNPGVAYAVAKRIIEKRSLYLRSIQDLRDVRFETERELKDFRIALLVYSHDDPDLKAVLLPRRELTELYDNAEAKFARSNEGGADHRLMTGSIKLDGSKAA